MKKIIVLNILVLLAGCGPSQEERVNIALNACAVMGESKKSDSLFRMQTMVDAREKLGGEGFAGGDDAILEAFEFGICSELVLNESYDELLLSLKDAKRERERIAAEKLAEEKRIEAEKLAEEKRIEAERQRIADSKPTVKEEFYGNGRLKSRTNYQPVLNGGKKHGLFELFYKNGQLQLTQNYRDGKEDGVYEKYYENGRVKVRTVFKNGKREGPYEEYHENTQFKVQTVFKHGELEGDYLEYSKDGIVKEQISFKNGKREGLYIGYWDKGKLREVGNYKEGKRDGHFWFYEEDATTLSLVDWEEDIYYKTDIGYFLNGAFYPLQKEGIYKNGLRHGIHKTYESYRDKTLLRSKAEYKNGKREGLSFNYDGKRVLNSTCYKNDDEIIMSYCKK